MNNPNPFSTSFNLGHLMSQFSVSSMNNRYSKQFIDTHQKNLDSLVRANKLVTDGYKTVATKQMEIFQNNLHKMTSFSPKQMTGLSPFAFQEGAKQMKELVDIAGKAHQDAFTVLSSRGKEMLEEASIK